MVTQTSSLLLNVADKEVVGMLSWVVDRPVADNVVAADKPVVDNVAVDKPAADKLVADKNRDVDMDTDMVVDTAGVDIVETARVQLEK